jgi:hypothetical protein
MAEVLAHPLTCKCGECLHRIERETYRPPPCAECERLKAELAESDRQDDDRVAKERRFDGELGKETDGFLRRILGPEWSRLWGPELEQVGYVVDEMTRRERAATRELERLKMELDEANRFRALVSAQDAMDP